MMGERIIRYRHRRRTPHYLFFFFYLCSIWWSTIQVVNAKDEFEGTNDPPAPAVDYKYFVNSWTSTEYLIPLATHKFEQGGEIEVSIDVKLNVTSMEATKGRTMFYLLICDSRALSYFLNQGSSRKENTSGKSKGQENIPGYCNARDRSLSGLCSLYPLITTNSPSGNTNIYEGTRIISYFVPDEDDDTYRYIYLDACETLGGENAVLKSCLDSIKDFPVGSNSDCFYCPANGSSLDSPTVKSNSTSDACMIPQQISPNIRLSAKMNVCDGTGKCLESTPLGFVRFYLIFTFVWISSACLWAFHILYKSRKRRRNAIVSDFQKKLSLVPLTQILYGGIMYASLWYQAQVDKGDMFANDDIDGKTQQTAILDLLFYLRMLSQLLALTMATFFILIISKGWKITKVTLLSSEYSIHFFVPLLWIIPHTILKMRLTNHFYLVIFCTIAWFYVLIVLWNNTNVNVRLLHLQCEALEGMEVDPTTTPAMTKLNLLLFFARLVSVHLAFTWIFLLLSMRQDTIVLSSWYFLIADDTLGYLVYATVGYTFRCRQFRTAAFLVGLGQVTVQGDHTASGRIAAGLASIGNDSNSRTNSRMNSLIVPWRLNGNSNNSHTVKSSSGRTSSFAERFRRRSSMIFILNPDNGEAPVLGSPITEKAKKKKQQEQEQQEQQVQQQRRDITALISATLNGTPEQLVLVPATAATTTSTTTSTAATAVVVDRPLTFSGVNPAVEGKNPVPTTPASESQMMTDEEYVRALAAQLKQKD